MTVVTEGTRQAQPAPSLPLLMTKLNPPPRRKQTVARDRLIDRLRAGPGVKLTVVAAPAGSGKTTLLGTWRELEETSRPVAWVSLDEGDNDPVVLWSYILAALRGVCPELEVSSSPGRAGAARIVETFLPDLINSLAALGDAGLVLDDFHRLTGSVARESVAWFIERAPSTFQLVLATRTEPALAMSALRVHGALIEVRADELGFTPAEADVLLNDRLELGVEGADVDNLVERTEGWPAGLYLAALSLQAAEDRHAFVSSFGAQNRHVVDFLVDEVLEAYDPGTQALMLRSSILGRLCGSLCDAVLEQEGSDRQLASLAQTNLFLAPLDDRGEWYRFHRLFAQLLRVELEHREPELAATLHRRASEWHRANGSVEEAIEHAFEAGAFQEAAELIGATWAQYAEVCRYATVLAWLERFPPALLRESPVLLLAAAWMHSASGERDTAAEAIAALERIAPLREGPLPDGFSSVEASLATLRGLITWGDTRTGLANARRAAELEGPNSPWRPVICCAIGQGLYFSGAFEEADLWLTEAAEIAPGRAQWLIAATALAHCSFVAGKLGDVERQAALAERAVEVARERGSDAADGEVFVALGSSLAERGRMDEALPMLEQGVGIRRSIAHHRPLADALIRQATVLRATGAEETAEETFDEARAIIDSCPDPGVLGDWLSEARGAPPRARSETASLSERELVILRMLEGPLSERDIGRELYLSHNTVHSHTRSIYRKLGVSSRSEAVGQARSRRLI